MAPKKWGITTIPSEIDGATCLAFDSAGARIIVVGLHGKFCAHDIVLRTSYLHSEIKSDAVFSCISFSPSGNQFVASSLDCIVHLFSYPDCNFEKVICRSDSPAYSISYNRQGNMLCIGEDNGVKIISAVDYSTIWKLRTTHEMVKNAPLIFSWIDFDPRGEMVAGLAATGDLFFWNLNNGSLISRYNGEDRSITNTVGGFASLTGIDPILLTRGCWSPNGKYILLPSPSGGIVCIDRTSRSIKRTLVGPHTSPLIMVRHSPNGLYAASSDISGNICIWDLTVGVDIMFTRHEACVVSICWSPSRNQLVFLDVKGAWGVLDEIIPKHMPDPWKVHGSDRENLNLDWSDVDVANDCGPQYPDQAIRSVQNNNLPIPSSILGRSDSCQSNFKASESIKYFSNNAQQILQVLHSGSTPFSYAHKRRFLAWNSSGYITCRSERLEGRSSRPEKFLCFSIEVHFNDMNIPRLPAIKDYVGYTMGHISNTCFILGSPINKSFGGGSLPFGFVEKGSVQEYCEIEKQEFATIYFKQNNSWTSDKDWTIPLPSDVDIIAVVCGNSWCAVACTNGNLRLFSATGVQYSICSIPCRPFFSFMCCDDGSRLGYSWYANGTYKVSVYDMRDINFYNPELVAVDMHLNPNSHVTWIGLSSTGTPMSVDSTGTCRNFQYYDGGRGGLFFPLLPSEQSGSNFSKWVVSMDRQNLTCAVFRPGGDGDVFPKTHPIPSLISIPLRAPLLSRTSTFSTLEGECIAAEDHLHCIQMKGDFENDEVNSARTVIDKIRLRMIYESAKSGLQGRAYELTLRLKHKRSLEGALKLVNTLGLKVLAGRISEIVNDVSHAEGPHAKRKRISMSSKEGIEEQRNDLL